MARKMLWLKLAWPHTLTHTLSKDLFGFLLSCGVQSRRAQRQVGETQLKPAILCLAHSPHTPIVAKIRRTQDTGRRAGRQAGRRAGSQAAWKGGSSEEANVQTVPPLL